MDVQKISVQKLPAMAAIGFLGFLGIMLLMSTYFGIDAGERGVVLRFGEVNRIVDPGPRFKVPLAEEVVRMTVRVQKGTTKTEAASKGSAGRPDYDGAELQSRS